MSSFTTIDGDLIALAKKGLFDVIAHGCNCQNLQGAGMATQMAKAFHTDDYPLEQKQFKGDIDKLGRIQWRTVQGPTKPFYVVNCYTQYEPGANLDYDALTLCMRKINHDFKGKDIGLPMIGAGIAGGDWNCIETIIRNELHHVNVTIVKYKPQTTTI
jgi:O-acetyl-ADP-ribose deacetylase (regulator of RNase III)